MPNYFTCVVKQNRRQVRAVSAVWDVTQSLSDNLTQTQGLWESLTAKIINNVQVTVKNIHIRYEDNLSVPGVRSAQRSLL